MNSGELGASVIFQLGPLTITDTVLTTWGIMLACTVLAATLRRGLRDDQPARWQVVITSYSIHYTKLYDHISTHFTATRGILPPSAIL